MSEYLVEKSETNNLVQIKANSKFDAYNANQETITLLENTPANVNYARMDHSTNGSQNVEFNVRIGDNLQLDRGLFVSMRIPVRAVLTTAHSAAITEANYMTAFNNFNDLAFRQYALLNCIQNIQLQLNGTTVSNVSNICDYFRDVAQYYKPEEISQFLQASMPDRFTAYNQYGSATAVTSLDEHGHQIRYLPSVISQNNIFEGTYDPLRTSRKPFLSWIAADGTADTTSAILGVNCWAFIPFSVFGIPSTEDLSLIGVDTMKLSVQLRADFVKHLFVVKGTHISLLEFGASRSEEHKSTLSYKTYLPPEYVRSAMFDESTGVPRPYRIGTSELETTIKVRKENIASLAKGVDIRSGQISLPTVPRSFYISVVGVPGTPTKPFLTPNVYGRIKAIRMNLGGSETSVCNNVLDLFQNCKSNGLNEPWESVYGNGFTVKINMNKDLSANSHLIGTATPQNCTITVEFDALHSVGFMSYDLQIISVFSAQLEYNNRVFTPKRSLLTSGGTLDMKMHAEALYNSHVISPLVIGGFSLSSIFNPIKNAVSKGVKYIVQNPKKTVDFLKKAYNWTQSGGSYNNITGGARGQHIPRGMGQLGGNSSTLTLGAGMSSGGLFK